MRSLKLLLFAVLFVGAAHAQSYQANYLDGRILFQLKGDTYPNQLQKDQVDPNDFSLVEELSQYPEIASLFEDVSITKFERPSYFTFKPSLMNMYRIQFTDFSKVDELIKSLQSISSVVFAEKEPIYFTDFVPNDPSHTGSDKWYHTLVGSENAWNIHQGRNQVKVAIVDNAVYCGHSDLTTFKQYDVADNDQNATPPQTYSQDNGWSHGTHCAGLATADINNGVGIAGLGGNVELIGVKCTPNTSTSSGSVWYGYAGVQWACQNGAHVVSMSFGGTGFSQSFQNLINAYPQVVFLAAAGNSNVSTLTYPGAYTNVICVGSVDATDLRSSFSNYNGANPYVDIASPGGYSNGGLLSTVYSTGGNSYAKMGGTSMATPFAAGLVGLMLSVNPSLSPQQILTCLISSGVNINQNVGPRINAFAAMQCASQGLISGAPISNFFGIPTTLFEGDSVKYYENCSNGGNAISSYQWSFPGGTPSSFSGQNPPYVTYAAAGTYSVTLTVSNVTANDTETKVGYITVNTPPYGNWIIQNSGFSQASRGINYISIVDQNIVWSTAYDGSGTAANIQQFTKTLDGGNTWTPGNINVGNTSLGISMIKAISGTTAWLAAYPNTAGQLGGIWKTINGGSTWTKQTTATFSNASSFTNIVHFWNANDGFCMGDPINGEYEIYRTTNGGTNWTLVSGANIPNPLSGEFGYTRQIETFGNSVWFTTNKGRIYHSTDKGATWAVYTSPLIDFGGTTMSGNFSFSSLNAGIIVNVNGLVYKSANAGATWTLVTTTGPVFSNGVCAIENTNVIFTTGAATTGSGSSYSLDGGTTWTGIDNAQHLYCEFLTPSIGWSGSFNTSSTQNGMWKWNNLSSPLSVQFSANPATVCVNTPVQFSDQTTGGTITSWNWSFPNGSPATSTLQNPTVTYFQPGTYAVSLTASDGTFLSSYQDTAFIVVEAPPANPSAIVGNVAPCINTLENYSVTNDPAVFYNWTLQSGWLGMSNSNTIAVTFDNTSGPLSVTTNNSCGASAPSVLNINVGAAPVALFSYTLNGGVLTLTNNSLNASNYSWDFGNGITSNATDTSITYTSPGSYSITLLATDNCGVSDTLIQVIQVLGLVDLASQAVTVYPNPTTGVIFIQLMDKGLMGEKMSLFDIAGRKVMEKIITQENESIDLSSFKSGIYLLNILGESTRIVKE